jgi:2,3-bisphosphoglycerate-independent phosphoglycerate mutase
MRRKVALVIMDGWGLRESRWGNALKSANLPNYQKLSLNYPSTQLIASGLDVGLPEGQMGNSEVGHLNIGAGRIVYQDFTRITKDIREGTFYKNQTLLKLMEMTVLGNNVLHIMGLLSDGGVHSHNSHLYAILRMAKDAGLREVYIHTFLDGRDVPPQNALFYIQELEREAEKIGVGKIATISGRYYSMDRDKRWDRTEKSYNALVFGLGQRVKSPTEGVMWAYENKQTDEFVVPLVIEDKKGSPIGLINEGDGILFFNFRPDRARQITRAFVDKEFPHFERSKGAFPVNFVCMTQYDETLEGVEIVYKPSYLKNTLGEVVSREGLIQLRIAETEKYAHVTFFFNGGDEKEFPGEIRRLIPSPRVATYDLKPEMSAFEVTERLMEDVGLVDYHLVILNYANADMVGHTGDFKAAVKAVETVDTSLGKLIPFLRERDWEILITSDHGNAELMMEDCDNSPITAHTTNPVPFIYVGKERDIKLRPGRLGDIAPTILELMGIEKPAEMTGESLIIKE